MRILTFYLLIILFSSLNSFGQKIQEPNYPDCKGLREKNENYAVQDGGPYITWCEMKKQTSYVRCQCRRETMRKQYISQIEGIRNKMKQNSDQSKSLYKSYDNHYQSANKLKSKLYDDDNANFENDKRSAINEFRSAIQYREQQLKYLEENLKLCERISIDSYSCKSRNQDIKYAKDAIKYMNKDIVEINNMEKKKTLTLVLNNSNTNSYNSDSNNNSNNTLNNSSNNNINKNSSNFYNNNNSNSTTKNNNKTLSNNDKARNYYNSAYENAKKGNYSQGIKDLEMQKAYTKDPRERAKIDSNIKNLNARREHQNKIIKFNNYVKRENYLNEQSRIYMNKIDAATNGDHLAAAAQKFGYAIGSAVAGRVDVNSIAGTAVSVINFLGEKKRQKEALEAKKRAMKKKIEEENRKREIARKKYLNGLKRERAIVLKNIPEFFYPNYLYDNKITSYYYFVIYSNENILTNDYPDAEITDIIEIKKYNDGTWPFKNDFKTYIEKLSNKSVYKIVGFNNIENSSSKLATIIKGFGKGGVKLNFINTGKSKEANANKTKKESKKDFWGKSIKTTKKKNLKKSKKKTKKEDFWGKSIKIKN